MMIHVASDGLYHSPENVRKPQVFPERPNGGNWIAFGINEIDLVEKQEYFNSHI